MRIGGVGLWLLAGQLVVTSPGQTFSSPENFGQINTPQIDQASGLALSHRDPRVVWTHNDLTDGRIYALSTNGQLLASFHLGHSVADLEDLAIATLSGSPTIFVGDLGNNYGGRETVRILRLAEPAVDLAWASSPVESQLAGVDLFTLRYPDGLFNAEPLLIDPVENRLFILTKSSGNARIYSVSLNALTPGGTNLLQFDGEIYFPWLTAGTVSADGYRVALRSAGRAALWQRNTGQLIPELLRSAGTPIPVVGPPTEENGEGITFASAGYFTISEGTYPPLYFFRENTPPAEATAERLPDDSLTAGNWRNGYGADGHIIYADSSTLPAYVQFLVEGSSTWVWNGSTTDQRALTRAGGSGRLAACWYSPGSFSLRFTFLDAATHDVGLYLLDWDTHQRIQQVEVLDAATGELLDSRTVQSFNGGRYLSWRLRGDVRIRFTRLAGYNAVVSGIFFDTPSSIEPPPDPEPEPPAETALFVGTDSTTQGAWRDQIGSSGFAVVRDWTRTNPGISITPAGASSHIWAYNTEVPAALQKYSSPGRIASCWYASTSFAVDLAVPPGATHQVGCYFLDWDRGRRAQTVQVLDPSSGAILDSREVNAFENGVYFTWEIRGNVRLQFTRRAGPNAVLSGIFLD